MGHETFIQRRITTKNNINNNNKINTQEHDDDTSGKRKKRNTEIISKQIKMYRWGGIRSKRPQVKTAPNWSKRPQLQLQIGQNSPKQRSQNGPKFDLGAK